jgi:3-deoxy-D-manno-octulosonic-acid transferase
MWKIAYNTAVLVALPFFTILSIFKKKLRANFWERLLPAPAGLKGNSVLWIHAASIGEAVIAENIVNVLGKNREISFVMTTNTSYTRDLLRRKFQNLLPVHSAPLDLRFSLHRFMAGNLFSALVIVETEIWPNTIWTAKARGIPVIIVNGRISDATVARYRRLTFFLRPVLSSVDLILAQSEEHGRRFISLGVEPSKVIVTGNLKYYREVKEVSDVTSRERTVTFGSVRSRELPVLMPVIARLKQRFPECRFYVAPRELRIVDTLESEIPPGLNACRYSKLKRDSESRATDVVIVDTVGDLLEIYGRSTVAFVGGSLAPYGGQNVLEPIFAGTPPVFGPYVENFQDVADEIARQGAGFMVRDGNELFSAISALLDDPEKRKSLVEAGRTVLSLQKGIMEKTAALILEMIWKNSPSS